jgi:hypothetical protein
MNPIAKKQGNRVCGSLILLAGLLGCASLFASQQGKAPRKVEPSGSELVAAYKQWTRVNPVPEPVSARIAVQCAPPTATQTAMERDSPHRDKFITVYVNDIGRTAMMEEAQPHFPVGSIIVKEKLPGKDSTSPELLTVMIKREAGYDQAGGDWEYMALDGTGKTVQARGHLEKCQACHVMVKDTDYVSRIYLPQEIREKLK